MKEEDAVDYYGGLVRGRIPPRMHMTQRWDNSLQSDIIEIVISPFKNQDQVNDLLDSEAWKEFQKKLMEIYPNA